MTTPSKTYKREVAVSAIGLWAALVAWCVYDFWVHRDVTAFEVLKITSAPVWLFCGAAFGMDSASKQFGERK